jgi:hypothetical protein
VQLFWDQQEIEVSGQWSAVSDRRIVINASFVVRGDAAGKFLAKQHEGQRRQAFKFFIRELLHVLRSFALCFFCGFA